jgi:hypothetical protein
VLSHIEYIFIFFDVTHNILNRLKFNSMAIHIIISEECRKDLQEHQMESTVNSFRDRILSDQRLNLFDNFPPPFLKKRFSRQHRLLAASINVENTDDVVVIFLRFLIRGGNEYLSFVEDPKSFRAAWVDGFYTQDYLREWLEQNRTVILPVMKDLPNAEEMEFLWGINENESNINTEEFIFETPDWISAIKDEKMKRNLVLLPDHIMRLTEKDEPSYGIEQLPENLCIVYRNFKAYRRLFLAGIFANKDLEGMDRIIQKYEYILKKDTVREDDISKASKRSYPALLLADKDLWFGTQTDDEANLSLSPEESDLLRSAYEYAQSPNEVAGFPMFINGRAGSGKSTILQYLFADYIGYFFLKNVITFKPPIFITYSGDLVEKSRRSVNNILKFNYKFVINEKSEFSEEDKDAIVNDSITPFRKLLLSMVANSEHADRFQPSLYVDFKRFKTEWRKRFRGHLGSGTGITPEVSWHVIRTYIKGYIIDDYMDEEEYVELPRDEKTVTRDTFETVYQVVFENWYKGMCSQSDPESTHWDDQDLIRFVLENNLIKSEYPAIFCDEAQDFTRIELELLFRMSIYSNRRIDGQMLNRVPFVFAGDPFQTLNPTGFKWDNMKTAFAQKFIHSLDPKLRFGTSQIHYKELSFNYRSTRDIVRMCNSIQAVRALYFGHSNLTPQSAWQLDIDSAVPVYFATEDSQVWEKIRENKDIRIIVPCGEGEESEYVKNDSMLRKYIEVDDRNIPRNVISPLRSKGLEYERVIVYGFGSHPIAADFFSKISNLNNLKLEDREQLLPFEYFLNQLYVAVSRAKNVLIVVDSRRAIEGFWEFVRDPDFVANRFDEEGEDFSIWEDATGTLKSGTESIWTGHIENKKELADSMYKEGMDKMSAFILRQAAFIYHERDELSKENKCRAYAHYFEGDYLSSGEHFERCSLRDEAIDAFWKGKCFNKLVALSNAFPDTATTLKVRIANQFQSPQLGATSFLLKDLHLEMKDEKKGIDWIGDATLKEGLSGILETLSKLGGKEQAEDYARMAAVLVMLLDNDQIAPSAIVADLLVKAGKWERALEILRKIGATSGSQYEQLLRQKVQRKLSNPGEMGVLTEDEKRVAARVLLGEDKLLEGAGLFQSIGDTKSLLEVASNAFRKDWQLFVEILKILILTHINKREFRTALSFVDGSSNPGLRSTPFYHKLPDLSDKLSIYLTKELAISPFLHLSDQVELVRISEFLKIKFLENRLADWPKRIHPLAVGAAMERAGKDTDCLKFYGSLETSSKESSDTRENAKKRLAATKLRRSKREEREGRIEQSTRSYEEAVSKANEIGVNLSDLPQFPIVTKYLLDFVKTDVGSPELVNVEQVGIPESLNQPMSAVSHPVIRELNVFDLFIKANTAAKSIQVFNTKRFSTVEFHYMDSRLVDNDRVITEDSGDLLIKDWGVRIVGWKDIKQDGKFAFQFFDEGVDFIIKLF